MTDNGRVYLRPGWLVRQFKQVDEEVAQWPEYMKREAGFLLFDDYSEAEELTLP